MWLSNGDRLARLVCPCRLFFFLITDAYEPGARSADSRTIGDGERHERRNSWQLEEKGYQTRTDWCCFYVVLLLASTSVKVGENPDHDKATTLSEKLVEGGKRKR